MNTNIRTYDNKINQIHFFDLDGTLWKVDAKWQIIDKNDPANYILRISQYEGALLQGGFWRADGHYIKYNGAEGWISEPMWKRIQSIKKIDEKDLGYSWREFNDTQLIKNQAKDVYFNIHVINHLKGTKDVVNLLTARGNKDAHDLLLNKLNAELAKLDIKINDSIFVNDPKCINNQSSTATKKALCILKSMIGYEIEGNEFVPKECPKFDISNFYDDEEKNIEEAKNIKLLMEKILEGTMPKLKDIIFRDIANRCPILRIHLVSSNIENPFTTEEISPI